ncbi:MAG TPA: antitoxin [Persephonella sp.]|uniref:Antitoxin n=1 Tax=Persephonella marina (strain DSM 14350 / EX-H1) TaxID=123214 RepID=C0QSI2_PERMH|nr:MULTISPECIES: DUF6364 family protein [Persephonella]ACO04783.1 hypothetical protein PERMA_1866 [Persephonella marina EX-H1]HCB69374.1 antitoxin [Persephonella sp.]
MKTKLTLRMEKDVIEKIKEVSKEKGISVSKLIENFFKTLTKEEEENLTPTVKKLKGILKNKEIDEDEYRKYLEDKYL